MQKKVNFLLVPDVSASKKIKMALAKRASWQNILIGTWPELISFLTRLYFIGSSSNDWQKTLTKAVHTIDEAFWSKNLAIAPEETIDIIGDTLGMLIESMRPGSSIESSPPSGSLSPRARKRMEDFARLQKALNGSLPDHLSVIRQLLNADSLKAQRPVIVYNVDNLPRLNTWQRALLDKLKFDHALEQDKDLMDMLRSELDVIPLGQKDPSLFQIQSRLYSSGGEKVALSLKAVQWLGVRDYLEEIEVTAGMIQRSLLEDETLRPSEIAIILPSANEYLTGISQVFHKAGFHLSCLPISYRKRNLAKEVLHAFLTCGKRPVPRMACSSLVTSHLMPWSLDEGHLLAHNLMNGGTLQPLKHFDSKRKMLIGLINQIDLNEAAHDLAQIVNNFCSLIIELKNCDSLSKHLANLQKYRVEISDHFLNNGSIETAFRMVLPEPSANAAYSEAVREGITVFAEHDEPWRSVRHIYVLGFSEGRYPSQPGRSAVFFDDDLEELQKNPSYDVEGRGSFLSRRRMLFIRQISSASERLVMLIPGRDLHGKILAPSSSLAFMAALFKDVSSPDELIANTTTSYGVQNVNGLSVAQASPPVPPRELVIPKLEFNMNLFELRKDEAGNQKSESPSGLERLMVSPFAWLIGKAGLKPREWERESLSVAAKGNIAHDVMEHLFQPGETIPAPQEVEYRISDLMEEAIKRKAPYLAAKEWQVERANLESEIIKAAKYWSEFLSGNSATVLGNEISLKGKLGEISVRGIADILLSLPENRLLVVDYKKSSSSTRKKQMEKGFEIQGSLYRTMLNTGGVTNAKNDLLSTALEKNPEIGIAYYTLNDQAILADSEDWLSKDLPGITEYQSDVSGGAMELVSVRIQEIQNGIVRVNSIDDEEYFEENAGIPLKYSIGISPLVRLFMQAGEE